MIRTPGQIERASMALIRAELRERGITLPTENEAVILRCIHASADFDYAANLRFTQGAVKKATDALHSGTELVTDTNMALAGISRPGLQKLGVSAYCYMAETFIADRAKAEGSTRAAAAMDWAAEQNPGAILAVGTDSAAADRGADPGRTAPGVGDRGAGGLCKRRGEQRADLCGLRRSGCPLHCGHGPQRRQQHRRGDLQRADLFRGGSPGTRCERLELT